jgi:FtsH-binding integral membrane protein
MKIGRMIHWVDSPLVFILIFVGAIPLILIRLLGFLFFASTTSTWAIVPAVALGALLAVSRLPQPVRRYGALALLMAYLFSVYFHGWPNLMFRLADGRDARYEGAEAVLIALLVMQCFMRTGAGADKRTRTEQ